MKNLTVITGAVSRRVLHRADNVFPWDALDYAKAELERRKWYRRNRKDNLIMALAVAFAAYHNHFPETSLEEFLQDVDYGCTKSDVTFYLEYIQ